MPRRVIAGAAASGTSLIAPARPSHAPERPGLRALWPAMRIAMPATRSKRVSASRPEHEHLTL